VDENSSLEWKSRKNLKQNSSFNQAHQTIENYVSIKSTERRIRHLFIWWVQSPSEEKSQLEIPSYSIKFQEKFNHGSRMIISQNEWKWERY